jgi:hypothetical protein
MSVERPEAGGPAQPSPDASVPPKPEVMAPSSAEPTLPQHTVEPTRTSMVWTMVGIGVVLLLASSCSSCRTVSGCGCGS